MFLRKGRITWREVESRSSKSSIIPVVDRSNLKDLEISWFVLIR
jgi:hypothetical protein